MADEAFQSGETVYAIARALLNFDPEKPETGDALEKIWKENADMIQDLIYLYSEYLYRVFMQDSLKNPTPITPEDISEVG